MKINRTIFIPKKIFKLKIENDGREFWGRKQNSIVER